jgi:hypothetical protein
MSPKGTVRHHPGRRGSVVDQLSEAMKASGHCAPFTGADGAHCPHGRERKRGLPIRLGEMELAPMRVILIVGAVTLALAGTPNHTDAKGCIRGAVAGGVTGHFAGHHSLLGAASGCAIGHHEAAKNAREQQHPQ